MYDLVLALETKLTALEKVFNLSALEAELKKLDEKIEDPNLWADKLLAQKVQKERKRLNELVSQFKTLQTELADAKEFAPMFGQGDGALDTELQDKLKKVELKLSELEFQKMLSGEFDASNAILTVTSGAGGTEAQDWVQMLLRMYMRWAEVKGFKCEVVDAMPGEEAGLKNATVTVEGKNAYGFLRAEIGIHRLVRISPFDSSSRRHTSFASVSVLPEIEDDIDIEINEEDLRIDTYRSSGAGGQHVNKTDSAVRLTHLPSGIVVACQNERSQHKNKATAMKVLKAKLYEKERLEREKHREKLAGEKKEIGFGSQIRSYTLQPYQLIKDHRTEVESGKTQAILDGDIDEFIKAYLLMQASAG